MKRWLAVSILAACLLGATPRLAWADMAPPDFPGGANLAPGAEITQVRMAAERVMVEVLEDPSPDPQSPGMARTTADFTMINLGGETEAFQARFPLSFEDGSNDGYFDYPEIREFQVWVDGVETPFTRALVVTTPPWGDPHEVPWAEFPVSFPPGKEVRVRVTYLTDGVGLLPFARFRYIVHTGAGWKDAIGSAEIILRLPYPATPENVVWNELGLGSTTPGGEWSGNEVRWSFEDLEPTAEDDLAFQVIAPALWRKVLKARAETAAAPQDGEAWGRLGKAIKETLVMKRSLRSDPAGLALLEEAKQAYEQSLALLPEDALWHYGYADLLWLEYSYGLAWTENADKAGVVLALEHLRRALELDPQNERALELLAWICDSLPEYVTKTDDQHYDFLALTATPAVTPAVTETIVPKASPTQLPPTATRVAPSATATLAATQGTARNEKTSAPRASITPTPANQRPGLPGCASGWGLMALVAVVWFGLRRV